MILFKIGIRAFFVHGFAKNEQDNIGDIELTTLKKLAIKRFTYTDAELAEAIQTKICHEQTIS